MTVFRQDDVGKHIQTVVEDTERKIIILMSPNKQAEPQKLPKLSPCWHKCGDLSPAWLLNYFSPCIH